MGFFRVAYWLAKGFARIASPVAEAVERFRARRRWRCPSCQGRELARLEKALWTGIPGTVRCHKLRCRACGEELFAVENDPPMTMAEHAAWCDAKQMRVLAYAGAEFPKAAALPPGKRSSPS
jgi:hypothetical protein